MPQLGSYILDRANDIKVHLWLRGRHPLPDVDRVRAYAASPPRPLHPGPDELQPFEPDRRGDPGHVETWTAASPWPQADGANARWVASRVRPRDGQGAESPAVVLLHGWLVTRLQMSLYRIYAARLAARGLEVWIPRLPHHMERTEPGDLSGQRCLSSDLVGTAESLRLAVAETRALGAWLRRSGRPVMLWGTSLGGWVGALVAGLEDGWRSLALWAPVASPAQVLWDAEVTRYLRAAVERAGIRRGDETAALGGYGPIEYPPRLERHRVLLVAGLWDRIVHAPTIARLARAWSVDVTWVSQGHIGLMVSPATLATTVEFLAGATDGRTLDESFGP